MPASLGGRKIEVRMVSDPAGRPGDTGEGDADVACGLFSGELMNQLQRGFDFVGFTRSTQGDSGTVKGASSPVEMSNMRKNFHSIQSKTDAKGGINQPSAL